MGNLFLPVVLAIAASLTGSHAASHRPAVAVQPFGHLDAAVVEQVKAGIEARFDVDVVVLPERALPASAYYRPRDRYRADALLEALDREATGPYAKVVGLTACDISTSTEEHADWGVFGLGDVDGPSCVISTYRLRRGAASAALVEDRLVKAVDHELGHAFGLEHCLVPGCLMDDAEGTIRTVDAGGGRFCPACLARLGAVARIDTAEPAHAATHGR
jgi:archaemetzincin